MAENGIIQQYAAHLERKASGLVMRWTLGLGFAGALLGLFPFAHVSHGVVPAHLGYFTVLLGAFAGAYLGYSTGEKRAVEPRMQAQLALHQLQVEQSLISRAAAPAPAPAAAAAAVPVAAPVPAPAQAPAAPPVAVAVAPVAQPAPVVPAAPPVVAPEPAPLPAPAVAAQAGPAPVAAVPAAPVADLPRLVEPPHEPPLSQPVGL